MGETRTINVFEGKKIILGITGSIAAYKSLLLIRELVRRGAIVYPVLTPTALHFVTPITVSNLARNEVIVDMFDSEIQRKGAWHIDLVHQCDLMIIAPATASTIGKIANGICDNALATLATALPKGIPLLVAPAMDSSMYENPTTQRNIEILKNDGVFIIPPSYGELSSGLFGEGRLPEIPALMDYIETYLYFKEIGLGKANEIRQRISNKKVLITAGPTYEKIDDVRFISNFSSGKMGFALAKQCQILGAQVKLISGPTHIELHHNIEMTKVTSAKEMFDEVAKHYSDVDIVFMASAVADFTPIEPFSGKFKKERAESLEIKLRRTVDILGFLGKEKKNQLLVGFALEDTANGLTNAWRKLIQKNCDMIVLNYFDKEKSGFGGNFNTMTLLGFASENELFIEDFPPMSKNLCALIILNKLASIIN
ncbi:bifunctional phosphopantothenoylcysteine decarboxylase/phosphopantothenate--cysteine ligase CoaBC [Bacteroidetes/Chlorobi group bacterium Naka2016]|jgi:phosphopantothenoylcysteine decarboxylase/phosphopantothenate--cysteine ligase|nr:MAG: bifunctional phosphopantothenoylcysteine decarboxylase/phosphopantothenate--cysteine ligase CoaBC [Bacteroidetes/Chlorobi group bacterium Naka2016]